MQKTILESRCFTDILGSKLFWGTGAFLEESSIKFYYVLQEVRVLGLEETVIQRQLRFLNDSGSLSTHKTDQIANCTAAVQG